MDRFIHTIALATTAALLALVIAAAPALAGKDRRAPKVRFTTEESATVSQATPVTGVATDKGSGIKKVVVTFCPGSKSEGSWTCNGLPESHTAELECHDSRTHCLWSAAPPVTPGSHLVFVKAVDRAKNKAFKGPREVFVI